MEMISKINELIDKRINLDVNDDGGYREIRNQEMLLLTLNLNDTMSLLDTIDAQHFNYLSENFEDLSVYFNSKELIDCMKRNAIRTKTDCDVDITYAIKALK